MRRIIIKKMVLRQCMLDSVDDNLVDSVLHNQVIIFLRKHRVSIIRKRGCSLRRWCQRKSWEAFSADLTERQFRRYFRMSCECFELLCNEIKRNVGEGVFKSEEFTTQLSGRGPNEDASTAAFHVYWWDHLRWSQISDHIVHACRGVQFRLLILMPFLIMSFFIGTATTS